MLIKESDDEQVISIRKQLLLSNCVLISRVGAGVQQAAWGLMAVRVRAAPPGPSRARKVRPQLVPSLAAGNLSLYPNLVIVRYLANLLPYYQSKDSESLLSSPASGATSFA